MTDMKRLSVSLPDDMVQGIGALKETEQFQKCTFSEIIRQCIRAGLPNLETLASGEKGA